MSVLTTRAPAKINLTLHILGRRPGDGYHALESLVAFADVADTLELVPGPDLTLDISGPTAGPAGPLDDNLVLRAARHLAAGVDGLRLGAFRLHKQLPVAAGIGGGSSDAAAALRLLAELNGLALDHPAVIAAARATGADVPVCLDPRARMMRGAGEEIGPVLGLASLPAVLVNPGVPVSTAPVFKALGLAVGQRLDGAELPVVGASLNADAVLAVITPARNDLEAPALTVAPVIGEALALLRAQAGCRLARMSGSGATVFAIFSDDGAAETAAAAIRTAEPGWWVEPTRLA
ncbi:4-(cytidine 5'-diphospho)-2-C-methyl-D-erythritol kinase [Methylorubrum extorquens]|uniref:4-diphosphocytidyl-2-C-methyl-D-erythritol kinase n=1 Tax=Methylorubrum extorquens (strain CM4 / NCIMB 13688) TaxID=440085 RepID=ISPE_METC4|nr:4-(cytidine 5'-diphospho)-2-C-methyl-D-erythritol kinase [Methylorubrum extorquens]B7KUL9.1 RecName: Full=4-diphosphocytidyl-2-C-methyl-D-erythritol kinase; Short=CMK; AltName: Full=4-(cytidine-5'-diphospho)-2-C-methyl-D-erythritol kinase [Methylorubrum extorquens CM4]ACK84248.1 4-(cytidine 5'-diphospho)-2-C-methyl-D-erythritol kinase [Methylorubrum extorquens CM4]